MDELTLHIRRLIEKYEVDLHENRTEDFVKWMLHDSCARYKEHLMNLKTLTATSINACPVTISNASAGKQYTSAPIALPVLEGVTYTFDCPPQTALAAQGPDENGNFILSGIPEEPGDYTLRLLATYPGMAEGDEPLVREIPFAVNPDPRTLWVEIPTPREIPYYKEDTACSYLRITPAADAADGKAVNVIGASRRGRSHARDGRPRDDDYTAAYMAETGWYVLVVADGAGSAKFSRAGSEIACRVSREVCEKALGTPEEAATLEGPIAAYHAVQDDAAAEEQARRAVGNKLYEILCRAAHDSYQSIHRAAENIEAKMREYSTTLLLAICKKFDFGWFVGSFWVGDGAIAIYRDDPREVWLMGEPDSGESSGQTRFLTMREIFSSHGSLYSRLRFRIVPDLTAVMLMSDGVSDPMFGTDAALKDPERWAELQRLLLEGFPEDRIAGVDLLSGDPGAAPQLLEWLNFWRIGEHDDRTLLILC